MGKIKFRDLNWVSKIGIIGGWITIVSWTISFFVGYVIGVIGYLE